MGMLRQVLTEAPLNLRVPQTPEQKRSYIELIRWISTKMQVPKEEVESAIKNAEKGEWDDAFYLLRTYYVMKGLKVQGG